MSDLKIKNWDKWQSYRADRGQPPWIKVHRDLMRRPEWVQLSDAQRGHLVCIWMLAADRNGVIPSNPALIRKLCFLDAEPDLQALVSLGFIHPDASVTPPRRQSDAPEERRVEAEESRDTSDFEAVWALSRRGSKKKALDQYRRAITKTDHDTILSARKTHVDAVSHPQYIKHLERWLRDECWADVETVSHTTPVGDGRPQPMRLRIPVRD
jgi:hypothetical protein